MRPQELEAPSSLQDSAGHGVRLNAALLECSRSHGLLGETRAVSPREGGASRPGSARAAIHAASLPDCRAELFQQPSADDASELLGVFVLHALISAE